MTPSESYLGDEIEKLEKEVRLVKEANKDLEMENIALRDDIKNLNWAFTEQAIKIDEKNFKIHALTEQIKGMERTLALYAKNEH